ncbi:(2Fe-2S)-binding protein [Romboutsia sp. 1001713B170207_170306_H8]|uniref:(2Fe-2S)-binding protein n=1 Tax=Romboutsia sp. 1001713B170207_170306_H8 TaxID=2787112 RepID=UPI000821CF6E|nr:(2Fe-2S)-binding protein [Romboutsia sp. 1001713B170207_170306_H8]SCH74328.1 nitrite reductase subunit NirD [uncultured Clostridium sp.]
MGLEKEKYLKIRKAQAQGVRTVEELKEMYNLEINDNEELKEIESLLRNACACKNVTIDEVVKAVENGADTVEKVGEATKAGTGCGRCKGIISDIIENKR